MTTIRIGTRGSRLALWQADTVAEALRAAWPEVRFERVETRRSRPSTAPSSTVSMVSTGLPNRSSREAPSTDIQSTA